MPLKSFTQTHSVTNVEATVSFTLKDIYRICHYVYAQKPYPMDRAFKLAGATGREPATSGVTGRRSNQLNYAPDISSE